MDVSSAIKRIKVSWSLWKYGSLVACNGLASVVCYVVGWQLSSRGSALPLSRSGAAATMIAIGFALYDYRSALAASEEKAYKTVEGLAKSLPLTGAASLEKVGKELRKNTVRANRWLGLLQGLVLIVATFVWGFGDLAAPLMASAASEGAAHTAHAALGTCGAALGHSLPTLGWWLSLTASDQGAWVGGLGAFFAGGVALWLGFSERLKERREAERIRFAISASLVADLRTVSSFFSANESAWREALNCADSARRCLTKVGWIRLPCFESFHDQLPGLGRRVAPVVMDAYGRILRLVSLANAQSNSDRKMADDISFVSSLLENSPALLKSIALAEHALKPYMSSVA